ncbi:MAG: hypothetical protein GY755_16705 [Chloroflexi bacterium]|nr:hypothetical protein [Chloroflexota bacterium]
MSHNNHKSGSGLLFPFILIAVGVAFLFQNLGLIGGSLWDVLVRMWPLLLIVVGLNDLIRTRGVVGPTLMIGLGAIFLANNLNMLQWDSWMAILRLWPVLIIAIGLEIFIGRKNIWLSAVGVGGALALLVGGLWLSGGVLGVEGVVPTGDILVSEEIEQPLDDAEFAEINIDSSIGALSVDSLSNDENLIEGKIFSVEREIIRQDYEKDGDEISYYLSSDWKTGAPTSFTGYEKERLSWDLALTQEIPLDLNIDLGVGESTMDLAELEIVDLDLSIGVGQAKVKLPAGEYRADVDGGVGQTIITLPDEGVIKLNVSGGIGEIVINIPEGMEAKIYVDRGIAGFSAPSGYIQDENSYISPNYDDAENYIILNLDQGIGNISIREK